MSNIHRKAVFLSTTGGQIDYVTPDGEVLASVAIPPGRIDAAPYLDLEVDGASPQIVGVAVLNPRSAYGAVEYGKGAHETAANPEFQPTPTSALEAEMRHMMRKMQVSERRREARMAALESVEHIPRREPDPVSEEITPAPAPSPAPAPAAE